MISEKSACHSKSFFLRTHFERNLNPINKKLNSTKEFSFRLAYLLQLQGRFDNVLFDNSTINRTKKSRTSQRSPYLLQLQGRFFRCQQKRYNKALSRKREKKEEKQLINLLERKTNIRLEIIQIMFGTDKDTDAQKAGGGVVVYNNEGG